MKKRFLSVLLVMSMLFSMMPTIFAEDARNNFTFTNLNGYDEGYDENKSPIDYLNIEHDGNGTITSVKVRPNGKIHNSSGQINVIIVYDVPLHDGFEYFDDNNPGRITGTSIASTAATFESNLPSYRVTKMLEKNSSDPQDIQEITDGQVQNPYKMFTLEGIDEKLATIDPEGMPGLTLQELMDYNMYYDKPGGNLITMDNFTPNVPIAVWVTSSVSGENYAFCYKTTIEMGQPGTINPEGPPVEGDKVGNVTISDLTDPVIGATKDEIASASESAGSNINTTPTVVWSGNFEDDGSTYKGGEQYTATITLTALNDAVFDTTKEIDINGTKISFGDSSLVTLSGDKKTATVTYTPDPTEMLKVISVEAVSSTLGKSAYKPGDSFSASGLTAKITYNDGTVVTDIDVTSNSYGIMANLAASGSAATNTNSHDTTLSLTSEKNVFIVYDPKEDSTVGLDPDNETLLKTAIVATITISNEAIDAAEVTLTYPIAGATSSASVTAGTGNYSVGNVTWTESSSNFSGTFEYGKTYTAEVTLTADTDYIFEDPLAVTLKDTGSGTDISNPNVTVDSNGYTSALVTYDFTLSAAPTISTTDEYDYYGDGTNRGNDVVVSYTDGTVNGVKVESNTLTAGTDYTVDTTAKTITIKAAKLNSIAGTSLNSTGTTWTVDVSIAGLTTDASTTFTAKDTTPYITITNPANGTISSSFTVTGTKQALIKNTQYVLTANPTVTHVTGYTWNVLGVSGTDSDNTHTFTTTTAGGDDITATVTIATATKNTLTVTAPNGSVVITEKIGASGTPSTISSPCDIYSDSTYTITATADAHYKFDSWTATGVSGTDADNVYTIANPSVGGTLTANFIAKTAAKLTIVEKDYYVDSKADLVYGGYSVGDYSEPTISIGSTALTKGADYTISGTDITILASSSTTVQNALGSTTATKTISFNFGEVAAKTGTIKVHPARTLDSVTAPTTTFKHGDTFDATGLAFTMTDDGNSKTYTYDGTSWSDTLPTDTKFKIGGGTYMNAATFISTYEAQIVRHDTTQTDTVNNGDIISVSVGNLTASASAITVGKKELTITPTTTTGITKEYDQTVFVTTAIAANDFSDQLVGSDVVTATIAGEYYVSNTPSSTAGEGKVVKFTATHAGDDKDNYTVATINDGSGSISKIELTIDSVTGIPDAKKGLPASGDVASTPITNTNVTSVKKILNDDTLNIKYDYVYDTSDDNTSTSVNITNIESLNINYSLTPTSLTGTGNRVDREIKAITVTPAETTYNYSDSLDNVTITVQYVDGKANTVYNSIADAKAADFTVQWSDNTAISDAQVLNVADHDGKKIKATKGAITGETTTAITVNPLHVTVAASGTVEKTYNGNTTYDPADGTITYTVTLASDAKYQTVFNTDAITATADVAYDKATVEASKVSFTNVLLSDTTNYTLDGTVASIAATIKKKAITITAIEGITAIPQHTTVLDGSGTTDTNSGNAKINDVVAGDNIGITYNYAYPDSTTPGDRTDVIVSNVDLSTDGATYPKNSNYTLSGTPTGKGSVTARNIDGISVTAPTQFGGAKKYGDTLDLAGLKVTIEYDNSTSEAYTWGATAWTKEATGEPNTTVTTLPFTWIWEDGAQPVQGETLTVAKNNKGITATLKDDLSQTKTSNKITVGKLQITEITVANVNEITKVYDSTTAIKQLADFTYAITNAATEVLSTDIDITVSPASVVYSDANASASNIPLTFGAWTFAGTNSENYELVASPTISGKTTGKITKRDVTVTGVSGIDPIDQHDSLVSKNVASDSAATFKAADADTGVVDTAPTISYKYIYSSSTTPGTEVDVDVTYIAIVGTSNYQLTNTTLTAKGTVNSKNANEITVGGSIETAYEYGDTLDLSGLTVTLKYSDTYSEIFETGDGTTWTKNNSPFNDALPFALTWTTGGAAVTHGDVLKEIKTLGTITATHKNIPAVTKAGTDSITVGKRQVTVTPSKSSDITKPYDGGTGYTNAGAITYTVASKTAGYNLEDDLTNISATYTFDSKDVLSATKVTVSNPSLESTYDSKYEIVDYNNVDLTGATITPVAITLTALTIPAVKQYASETTVHSGSQTNKTGATITDIIGTEEVTVTYNYRYKDTDVAGVGITDVEVTEIATADKNYTLTPTELTAKADVEAVTITVEVTNPTQLSANTYKYGDKLSLEGMEVKITTDGTVETYTANSDSEWVKAGTVVPSPPFTLVWDDVDGTPAVAKDQVLTVTGYNGKQIKATHGVSGASDVGDAVTINPKEITTITAATGPIEKIYDGDKTLDDDDRATITYSSDDVLAADTATVTLGATVEYNSKDVGDIIAIDFTTPTLSGNANYKLATNPTITDTIKGKITPKAIIIDTIEIPTTYVNLTPSADEKITVTKATIPGKVTTTGVIPADNSALEFNYTVVYAQSDLTSAGEKTVTIESTSVGGTAKDNYTYTWPSGLKGTILADKFTAIEVTAPSKMSYTHGEKLNLAGLAVKVTTDKNGSTETTYTVIDDSGTYKWDAALPSGVDVKIDGVSIDLNGQAHYKNMNGKKIEATAATYSNATAALAVTQIQLTATATETGTLEKVFDGTTNLPSGTSFTYAAGISEIKTFGSTQDVVTITADVAYESKDVADPKKIKFTNIDLDGADKDNYIKPASIADKDGKITPYTINVTAITTAIPDAEFKTEKTDSLEAADGDYTAVMPTAVSSKPTITFTYTYDTALVSTLGNKNVPITGVALKAPDSNYNVSTTVTTLPGKVVAKVIQNIAIKTQPKVSYIYGDTLDLSALEVTLTYADGTADVTYSEDATSDWVVLGLSIADGSLKHDDLLKATTNNKAKITVTSSNGKTAETGEITVEKRKLLIASDKTTGINKTYNATFAVPVNSVTLSISADQTGYDGLYTTDSTYTLSNTNPDYTYPSKNVEGPKALTVSAAPTLLGTNAGEYELTFPTLTGEITAKTVALTPVIADIPVNKYASGPKAITETNEDASKVSFTDTVFDAEKAGYEFSYTVTVSETQQRAVGTYTIEPTAIDVTTTNATNYPLTNYNFTWNNAMVKVVANEATDIAIKTPPKTSGYTYGDKLDLSALEVTVTYADSTTRDIKYGTTDWTTEGITLGWADGSTFDADAVLKTTNNQKIKVSLDTLSKETDNAVSVAKKDLQLTASGTPSKTYDRSTAVTAGQLTYAHTTGDVVTGDTVAVVSTGVSATYDNWNHGNGKTITVSGLTITATNAANDNVADQYNIIQPTGVNGDILVKNITVNVVSIPAILLGVTGNDLIVDVITSFNPAPIAADNVIVPVKATYADSNTIGYPVVSVTFGTITGNDAGNYNFTLPAGPFTGEIKSNVVKTISITDPSKYEYTHGDALDLDGMVINVEYINSTDDNVFMYQKATDKWKANSTVASTGKDTFTTAELAGLGILIGLDGGTFTQTNDAKMQLRRDDNNGNKLVVKGDEVTKDSITLTVNQKVIDEVTVAYVSGTIPPYDDTTITKTYDGDKKVEDDDQAIITYTPTGIVTTDEVTISAKAYYPGTEVVDKGVLTHSGFELGGNENHKNNYVLKTDGTGVTVSGVVKGSITKAPLTIRIEKVPQIFVGASKDVTLIKGTHFTQTGEVNSETISVAVAGEYSQNTTAATGVDVTYTVTPNTFTNYALIVLGEDTKGTVIDKPVTGIEITKPTDTEYVHGDVLNLDGMVITVKYSDNAADNKVYTFANGVWDVTPKDVEIVWGTTATAVTNDEVIRLDDTNKDLAVSGDGKTTNITVNATIHEGATAPTASVPVTLNKKQLTAEITGGISKIYDGNPDVTADTINNLSTALSGKVGTDDVSVKSIDGVAFGHKNAVDANSVTITGITLDGAAIDYYIVPSGTNLTNNATATISKKAFKVTAVPSPIVNVGDPATKTITIDNTDASKTYLTDPTDAIIGGETVKIDLTYTFTSGTDEPAESTPVTYSAIVTATDNDAAKNYDITFDITPGNGQVKGGEVSGVTVKSPTKTDYTHGDTIDLTGTEIVVTHDNNSNLTDKYVYDAATKQWTYTKNGVEQSGKVDLPSDIVLTFDGDSTPITPNTVVKLGEANGKALKVTVSSTGVDSKTAVSDKTFTVAQREITIDVSKTSDIAQTYAKNGGVLNAENLAKLTALISANTPILTDEEVTIDASKLKATFANENVIRETDGSIKVQDIEVKLVDLVLTGADSGNYKVTVVNNNAKGTVNPINVDLTANSVPSIGADATDPIVSVTDYATSTPFLAGDDITITWKGTYDMTTGMVDLTTTRDVTGTAKDNYNVTFSPDEIQGSITDKTVDKIEIKVQPDFTTKDNKHGDKIGEDGLDNFEFEVTYNDSSVTKHKMEDGEWKTDDGYTAPDAGLTLTWVNTNEEVSENSVIRKDNENKIKIALEGKTAETETVVAAKKPVTITANGNYTKVYDGTPTVTLNSTTPEITYTIADLETGDVVTVIATPAFADKNVTKFGDLYSKAIHFTNVSIAGDDADNYEIVLGADEKAIADIIGSITPKPINITDIKVSSVTRGSSVDVTASKSKNFTTTDIIAADEGTVTIGYKAKYSSTSSTGNNIPVTIDSDSLVIDGSDELAMTNYEIVKPFAGTATGTVTSGSTGGGGGGSSNSLTIHKVLEDEKTQKVTSLSGTAGEKQQLTGVFKSKLKDGTIIWTSSDEKVATVDENGNVTYVGEGEAKITATAKTNKALTNTIKVTVAASTATPTPIPTPTVTPTPTKDTSLVDKESLNPYIVGYEDGSFGPDKPISRQEVAAIMARILTNTIIADKDYPVGFYDVEDDLWSKNYIGYLEQFNIVSGYDDGSFMPFNNITRAEMAIVIAKAEGYDLSAYSEETPFSDVNEVDWWSAPAINCLSEAGILEGYTDGTYRPSQPITRAETVTMINNLLDPMEVEELLVSPTDVTSDHWAFDNILLSMNHRILKAVADSQSVKDQKDDNQSGTDPVSTLAPTTEPTIVPTIEPTIKPTETPETKK